MNDLNEFFRSYGESLASRLKAISHQPDQSRYIYIEDINSGEELVDARTKGLKPEMNVLVWERPTEQLSTGRRDNYNTRLQGSLTIIRKPPKESLELRQQTVDTCRTVALKVLALMLRDEQQQEGALSEEGIRFELDGQSGESIPKLNGGWYGYAFSFDFLVPLDLNLTEDDLV